MAYSSFDPRASIRTSIGYTWYNDEEDKDLSVVSCTNDRGDYIYVPLYLPGDVRTGSLPEMPFIEMTLITSPVGVHNVQGDVRDQECYIDFNIYYADMDNISPTAFGKTIADALVGKIMDYRQNISNCTWCEVINDGRELIEEYEEGKSVIFHRVVETYAKNYDNGI